MSSLCLKKKKKKILNSYYKKCVTVLNVSGTVGKTLVLPPLECELDLAACFSQNTARRCSMIRLHETVASPVSRLAPSPASLQMTLQPWLTS